MHKPRDPREFLAHEISNATVREFVIAYCNWHWCYLEGDAGKVETYQAKAESALATIRKHPLARLAGL